MLSQTLSFSARKFEAKCAATIEFDCGRTKAATARFRRAQVGEIESFPHQAVGQKHPRSRLRHSLHHRERRLAYEIAIIRLSIDTGELLENRPWQSLVNQFDQPIARPSWKRCHQADTERIR